MVLFSNNRFSWGKVGKVMLCLHYFQYRNSHTFISCFKTFAQIFIGIISNHYRHPLQTFSDFLNKNKKIWVCLLNNNFLEFLLLGGAPSSICNFFHPSVCLSAHLSTPYLRNHTSCDHNFWYTCKMMISQSIFLKF